MDPWSLPDNFAVPSASGKIKCSPFFGVVIFFALSLRAWISDVQVSQLLLSATKISPLHSRGIFQVKVSYQNGGAKRNYSPFEWFSKSSFIRSFPLCQEVLDISQITTAFHRISPDRNNTADIPSFYSGYRSLSNGIQPMNQTE